MNNELIKINDQLDELEKAFKDIKRLSEASKTNKN